MQRRQFLFAMAAVDLPLRSRSQLFKGSDTWQEVTTTVPIDPKRTAAIVCDMWDKHWCRGANIRVGGLVERMEPFLGKLRTHGVLIVHAPSETMTFYQDAPQRQAILRAPAAKTPTPLAIDAPALPIDDSDGGCDTDDRTYKAWTRQHPGLTIADADLISDNGAEIYSALQLRKIDTLLIMGVHTNMCILNRTFAIKQMTKWGMRCILVRDLTDSMYDPKDRPYVTHDQGTELVVQHIEKYWAPSTLSAQVIRAFEKSRAATRP
jgi:nicotinamidase-related amidase